MIAPPAWFRGDVSRETCERLEGFAALLVRWNAKINLVSRATVADIAERHIWDSAQIYQDDHGKWIDMGSGGGLPGVVIAMLAHGQGHPLDLTLVESDQRKAAFLRTCARALDVPFTVCAKRIEAVPPLAADIASARALAPLHQLFAWTVPHLEPTATCRFLKGAQWRSEIERAEEDWRFSYTAQPSMTHPEAVILNIKDIQRV